MSGNGEGLIERIEGAGGPDRELDALIAAACRVGAERWEWASNYPAWIGRTDGRVELERSGPSFAAPAYTASLDAAVSLVPEGRRMSVQQRRSYEPFWVCFMLDGGTEYDATAKASTLPLAICAAALKARKAAS